MYNEVTEEDGSVGYRVTRGTVEALGAIHFAPAKYRTGDAGIKPNQLYIELGLHGEKRKEQAEALGVRPGDPVLLDRPIKRCAAPNTFSGAYLDNGLGCFVAAEVARLVAEQSDPLQNVRLLASFASHEEIGRFGSRCDMPRVPALCYPALSFHNRSQQ
eukprot:SAG31_NODE_3764_length_3904_cov_1.346386_2_plen_159_part_00